ncbi:Rv1733c family protein [Streptacidiphilus sp. PAMC 29251]
MAIPAAVPGPSHHPAQRRSGLSAFLAHRHNPLWRRTDTLRGRLRALVLLGLAVAAGLSALGALGLYQHDRGHAQRYAARLHQVPAVALTAANQRSVGVGAGFTALVRWTDASGRTHQAQASVDPGTTAAGDRVTVWLDHAQRVSAPPTTAADSTGRAILLGGLLLAGSGSLVLTAGTLARAQLNRTDLRNWDRDWQHIEPTWSRRS